MPDAQIDDRGGWNRRPLRRPLAGQARLSRHRPRAGAGALEAAGAGIQLSPNASRILLDLGLGSALGGGDERA